MLDHRQQAIPQRIREPAGSRSEVDRADARRPIGRHREPAIDAETVGIDPVPLDEPSGVVRHASRERRDEQVGRGRTGVAGVGLVDDETWLPIATWKRSPSSCWTRMSDGASSRCDLTPVWSMEVVRRPPSARGVGDQAVDLPTAGGAEYARVTIATHLQDVCLDAAARHRRRERGGRRVAHRLSEVIAIYPITPASPMGELADAWSARGPDEPVGRRSRR